MFNVSDIKTPAMIQAEIVTGQTNEATALVYQKLEKLDRESIRVIREWVASQSTAPQTLKDREALAVAARVELKQFL